MRRRCGGGGVRRVACLSVFLSGDLSVTSAPTPTLIRTHCIFLFVCQVTFDTSKHLSDVALKRRQQERLRIQELERQREEQKRREKEEEERKEEERYSEENN